MVRDFDCVQNQIEVDALSLTEMDKIDILGIHIHPVGIAQLHTLISDLILHDKHGVVLNVNVYCLNLAFENPWLKALLNRAEVVFCDGAGVLLGAHVLGHKIPRRITYADWIWQLAEFSESKGFTFFFLGGRPGVADMAADRLRKQFPNLCVVGTNHGFFEKTVNGAENMAVIQQINKVKPDILVVGFGMPIQERWLLENWERIDANVALTGGAVFDYVSGELRRAPRWMTNNGFEWLGRLIIEPRRLWKRYLIGNPLFLYRVIKQRLGLLKFE
jgi:N-acetylglucosaminyldiphosphoundecaprenol N-acetyl-beta-D-mannosaminyltransferase